MVAVWVEETGWGCEVGLKPFLYLLLHLPIRVESQDPPVLVIHPLLAS